GTVCVVGKMRDLILQLSKSSIYSTKPIGFEEGVIIRSTLGRMIMAPALIAGHSELDELVEKTKRAVDRTAKEIGLL
ncbi:hypothetical protein ACPUGR_13265, partial [Klebsiella aerogenes]